MLTVAKTEYFALYLPGDLPLIGPAGVTVDSGNDVPEINIIMTIDPAGATTLQTDGIFGDLELPDSASPSYFLEMNLQIRSDVAMAHKEWVDSVEDPAYLIAEIEAPEGDDGYGELYRIASYTLSEWIIHIHES